MTRVIFEKQGPIAILTLNRPEARNAIDPEMRKELITAWTQFRDDEDLWVAIITGTGEKAFCAGADLKRMGEFYSLNPHKRREKLEKEPGLGGITRNLPIWKPIIAAINGAALGGGLELALSCDIRIASENAILGLPEVKWGIMPGAGGTQRLPRLIPLAKAMEMVFTGKTITAKEALELGLVNEVVPLSKLMETTLEMAKKICENGPLAVRAAKEAMIRGLDLNLEEALRLEQFLAEPIRQSEDAKEGIQAFKEKRKPNFKGR
ncbi:MAG: hypothetical protein D6785_13205 [Planctomycetota bacterium]|nr:MAG: hypothetical protein D6785_13205 [Planctomycetota bacterium]